ncbi:FAD-dependent oxidoreductase [Candidatus Woesearchaeota archaeon]|nr:FAD-dependent oxidoreductase [Candidatus Woesearchaeota archaeon]
MEAQIDNIRNDGEGIKRITISLNTSITPNPGQYIMISFPDSPDKKHAFSIVEHKEQVVELCIQEKGNFTQRLCSAKIGTTIHVFGPFGRFSIRKEDEEIIMVAGGIGITPLFNMLANHDAKEKVKLFYSTKSPMHVALRKELENLKNCSISYNFTSDGKRLTVENMLPYIRNIKKASYYICGPEKMMEDLRKQLEQNGADPDKIYSEEF